MFNFLAKKMMQSKMKDVPPEQQEKMFAMLEKNPALFQKIALEVQEKVKGGMDQMSASMEVAKAYQDELRKLM